MPTVTKPIKESLIQEQLTTASFQVLAQIEWQVHGGGGSNPLGGIVGRLTKIRVFGLVCYVRENLMFDHFGIGSGGRLALKHGRIPKFAVQVLELAAPSERWEEVAAVVAQIEAQCCLAEGKQPRRILRNQRFTQNWAEDQFSRNP